MAQNAADKAAKSEELKRQIEALTTDLVDAIDVLTRDLQRSLLMLADRVEQRMEAIGFGRLSGPVVNDIQEGVTAESKRFSEQARAKIQEITRAKAGLAGAADELSALASMTEAEREELRRRLQDEIAASQKTREELEKELADAKVRVADLEKRLQSQSTRDARRVDKLKETNKQLSESLKQAEAELIKVREESQKALSEREAALSQVNELNAKLASATAAAETASTTAAASKKELEAQVKTLTERLEQAQLAEAAAKKELAEKVTTVEEKLQTSEQEVVELRQSVQKLEKVKVKADQDSASLAELQRELSTSKSTIEAVNNQVADLEAQVQKLTTLKESQEQKIAALEEEQLGLKELTKDRDTISKDKEDLERRLEEALAEIEKMKEEYARFAEIRDRLEMLETRIGIQDILLQKNQQYLVLTAFATKIVEGKSRVGAKEIGFAPALGISLAAWLDTHFLELQEEGVVSIHRTAGRGLPSADIEVSKKGQQLFEEAKQKAAL